MVRAHKPGPNPVREPSPDSVAVRCPPRVPSKANRLARPLCPTRFVHSLARPMRSSDPRLPDQFKREAFNGAFGLGSWAGQVHFDGF
uniref:Uncharacterized protein n=1 Tax=Cucumis melo TaxID=3656 RepID=A0A9I9DZN5_CUCME